MNTRLFVETDPDELDADINCFIKGKKVIDIKFQENFSISEDYEDGMKSALIMYEEHENE